MFLIYGGEEELVAKCYVDASFDTDPDDSKSQSVYVFPLNGAALVGGVPNNLWWLDQQRRRNMSLL